MRFLLIGCGRAGSRLAQIMTTHGHDVTVVDIDPAALERVEGQRHVTTVRGVGFDRAVLIEAGIQRADGIAAVTGVDEVNVVVARLARRIFHVPRVVARVNDPRKAEIYRRLGIFTVSPLGWGVDRMAEALVRSELAPLLSMGSGEVNIIAVEASPLLAGRSVQTLTVPREVHVTAIQRQGHALLPGPETVFEEGDTIFLAVQARAAARLQALIGHA